MISAEHLHTLASETELNLRSSVLDESAVPALVDLLRGGSIERLDLRRCDGLTPEGAQALRDAAPPSTKLLLDAVIMPLASQSRPMTRSSSASHPESALPPKKRALTLAASASTPALSAPQPPQPPQPPPPPPPPLPRRREQQQPPAEAPTGPPPAPALARAPRSALQASPARRVRAPPPVPAAEPSPAGTTRRRREKLKAPTPKVALAPARRSAVRSASMSSLLLAWLNDASNPDAFPDPIPDPIPNPNPKPNP